VRLELRAASSRLSEGKLVLALAVCAFVVRVVATHAFPEARWDDAEHYNTLALNLLAGRGYSLDHTAPFAPSMYREPFYPVFLAFSYVLPGDDLIVARGLQKLLGAACSVLAYRLATELGLNRRVAIGAGLLAAFHPTLILYTGYILTETVSAFLVTLGCYALVRAWRRDSRSWFVLSGVVFGCGALTKSSLLLLPIALGLAFVVARLREGGWRFGRGSSRWIVNASLLGLAAGLTFGPWVVRNKLLFDTPSISTRGGEVLWGRAHMLHRTEMETEGDLYREYERLLALGMTGPQADRQMGQEAMRLIRAEPFEYLSENPAQILHMWVCSPNSGLAGSERSCESVRSCVVAGLRSFVRPVFFGLLGLMCAGGVSLARRREAALVPALTVAYLTLVHSFFIFNSCRFMVPVLPMAMILIAQGSYMVWGMLARLRSRTVTPA